MRFIIKFSFSNAKGNQRLKDPEFGHRVNQILADIKAEAAYFCPVDGVRGGYFVANFENASKIAEYIEPFFFWLEANVELIPVMTLEDLKAAGPAIESAIKKWG